MNPNGPDGIPGTPDDDYRLQYTSPCVDKGNSLDLPPDITDVDGDGDIDEPIPLDLPGGMRVQGTTVDMGAYEVLVGPCPPGTFSQNGEQPCEPCPAETYQPDSGATSCQPCDCDDDLDCTSNDCDGVDGMCVNSEISNCAIPTVSEWGVVAMALLLLIFGTLIFRNASQPALVRTRPA